MIDSPAPASDRLQNLRMRLAPLKEDPGSVMEALYVAQEIFGFVSRESIEVISQELGYPEAHVFGVVTFYTMFYTEPQAGSIVRVCRDLSCHIAGAPRIAAAIEERAGIRNGESTPDGKLKTGAGLVPGAVRPGSRHCLWGSTCTVRSARPARSLWLTRSWPRNRRPPMEEIRVVNRNLGKPDSHTLAAFEAAGGYVQARRALHEMEPEAIIALMEESELKGRGGAFFPTGMKWKFVRADPNLPRYVVANGDESEPGTYCNRAILEEDPHNFIEGMIIAAFAVGAHTGYIYIRGEYGLAIERVQAALDECFAAGILGENSLGSGYPVKLILRRGAGAYICGEETALFNSLEGKRGNPRFKPPFPTNSGVWSKPTAINNIETFCNIAPILENGAQWFKDLGIGDANAGTKVYCLSGTIQRTGLFELPLGVTARELIYDFGGGPPEGRALKGFKPGGASAAVLTADELDARMDASIGQYDTILGTGGCNRYGRDRVDG